MALLWVTNRRTEKLAWPWRVQCFSNWVTRNYSCFYYKDPLNKTMTFPWPWGLWLNGRFCIILNKTNKLWKMLHLPLTVINCTFLWFLHQGPEKKWVNQIRNTDGEMKTCFAHWTMWRHANLTQNSHLFWIYSVNGTLLNSLLSFTNSKVAYSCSL